MGEWGGWGFWIRLFLRRLVWMEDVFLALFAHLLWLVSGKVHKAGKMRQAGKELSEIEILKGRNCLLI